MVQPMVCPYAPDAQPRNLIAWAIGLLAALSFAHGSWVSGVLGALLLQWSSVIDCCDGEVARLKFLESTSGYYLDITCDNIVHVAVFVGIAWSGYQELGQTHVLLWRLGCLWDPDGLYHVLATRHGRARQASASSTGSSMPWPIEISHSFWLCALTGTLQWFLWALAIGVNLFWLIALGLARQAQRTAHG